MADDKLKQILRHRRGLQERLDEMDEKVRRPSFRDTTGKANEVNYWVFDYAPEQELDVRERITYMQKRNERGAEGFNLVVYDLYDLIMDYLESKGFIEKTEKMEERGGIGRVITAVQRTLKITDKDNYLVQHIAEHTPQNSVVFLIGIGKCYPLLQAPEVFNKVLYNMPQEFTSTPMVLFYPGTYTEQELVVFNEVVEDNYYRAFRIACWMSRPILRINCC